MATARSRKASYPSRYLGQEIERAVVRMVNDEGFASEAEVARWLERDPSTFSRWVNGFSHPSADQDWLVLTKLGIGSGFLRRLELLDKLDAWRADIALSVEEFVTLAVQVQNQARGTPIFRVHSGRTEAEPGHRDAPAQRRAR